MSQIIFTNARIERHACKFSLFWFVNDIEGVTDQVILKQVLATLDIKELCVQIAKSVMENHLTINAMNAPQME